MTQRPSQVQLDMLAKYLDSTLSAADRSAFEVSLARDPALKAELEFQRRLDSSLTRLFDDKPDAAEAPAVAGTISPATAAPNRRQWWFAAAAALLLAATLSIYFLSGPEDPNRITPDVLYARMERKNWVPEWKCENDQQFIEAVQKRLGEGMLIPGDTEGLEVIGWAYGSSYDGYPISPTSMILITKKDNDHVLLLVDKLSADARLDKPHKGLHLYRDTVGGLVLYELSPRADKVVIPVAKQNQSKACPNGKP
jgi:hypothetical protein